MKTILERRNFVRRQAKSLVHSRIAVTATTGLRRNVGRENRRSRFRARQNPVFSVAVGADRSPPLAAGECFTVDALLINFHNALVTLAAGLWKVRPGDHRTRVAAGCDAMRSMAIGTNSAGLSGGYSLCVDALKIGFNRPDDGNPKFFSQRRIGVAVGASLRNVRAVNRGILRARARQPMYVSMTT